MGSLDLLQIINEWHRTEDSEGAITGDIDLSAKERLAEKLETMLKLAPKAIIAPEKLSFNPGNYKPGGITEIEKPRRGRPPKYRG